MKTGICTKCGNEFVMGFDGITDPEICDACAGIERNPDNDDFWFPGEAEAKFVNVGEPLETAYTVKRPDNLVKRWRK